MAVEKTTPTRLRKEGRTYTVLPTDSIDLIQSGDALAIWAYLQSKPQNWIVRKADIMARLALGRMRYAEAMKHLRDLGLVAAAPNQGEAGRMTGRVLVCFDTAAGPKYTKPAISVTPKGTVSEIDGFPKVAKPSHIYIKEKTSNNNRFIHTENDGDERWHASHSDKDPAPAPDFPENPTHWSDKLVAERVAEFKAEQNEPDE